MKKLILISILTITANLYGNGRCYDGCESGTLCRAVCLNDVEGARRALNAGADVNEKDNWGDSVLSLATYYRMNIDIMKMLIEEGAGLRNLVSFINENRWSEEEERDLYQYLIDKVSGIDDRDYLLEDAFSGAVGHGRIIGTRLLLDAEVDINNQDESLGFTPLHYAVWNTESNIDMVKLLLDQEGVDVNILDKNGGTALQRAIERDHSWELTRAIILEFKKSGMDMSLLSKEALHKMLIRSGRDLEIVKVAIAAGVDVDGKDIYGHTALTYASKHNRPEIVKELIKAGADVEIQNEEDWYKHTALHYAAYHNSVEALKILLIGGTDVNVLSGNGVTALEWVQKIRGTSSDPRVIQLLEQAQAGDAERNVYAKLEYAIILDDLERVKELAPVMFGYWGECSPDKKAALELAWELGSEEVYEYLIEAWRVAEEGSWGETAVSVAEWACRLTP